jgi:hypothetical protein
MMLLLMLTNEQINTKTGLVVSTHINNITSMTVSIISIYALRISTGLTVSQEKHTVHVVSILEL